LTLTRLRRTLYQISAQYVFARLSQMPNLRHPKELWRYFAAAARSRQIVHLLHISKTGGTALTSALRAHLTTKTSAIFLHEHDWHLRHVEHGEKAIMFFRHPIPRFVSAFYSRRRCGRPRYDVPWNTAEAAAFAQFASPNELACALSSHEPALCTAAHAAMNGIRLLNDSFFKWVESEDYFAERGADILFVGFQENLAADFEVLKCLLQLPPQLKLPTDSWSSHSNPPADLRLDELASANLAIWYAKDIAFYEARKLAARPKTFV
jgi:hypothetical protein